MITIESDLASKHFHMIGVGGMGMAPLAIFLKQAGCRVTGEDDNFHPRVHQMLLGNGVEISNKPDWGSADGIIYSNAIGLNHPGLKSALAQKVPSMRRGEFLAALSKCFKTIAIAGSHGKTTTCGLLIYALTQSGIDFNYILGGLFSEDRLLPGHSNKESLWLVIEVDESDGSIESFVPAICLLVNVDWDHADYYQTKNKCTETFRQLIKRTSEHVFLNRSCELSRGLDLSGIDAAIHTFGENGEAQLTRFSNGTMEVSGSLPSCTLKVPFDEPFNAQNALAALSVVHLLKGKLNDSLLAAFPGLWRRQEVLFEKNGFSVVEDYGHHPTEIRKLFEAFHLKGGSISVVFQPHRYSRTLQFKSEFAEVLSQADRLLMMEVYGAGEDPIPGGTGTDLFNAYSEIAPDRESYFCKDQKAVLEQLAKLKQASGVLLFLGAGNIHNVAAEYVSNLNNNEAISNDEFLSDLKGRLGRDSLLKSNEPLAFKTTLRVGGFADYYAEPASETDLQVLLRKAAKYGVKIHFLGRGSNVVIPDSGVRGLVIRLSKPFFQKIEVMEDGRVRAGAGVRLKELCGFMRKLGVAGFEFLEGIPGNVGGALRMNAGAMGGWVSEVISEVVLMNYRGDISNISVEDLHFGYRHCHELNDAIGLAIVCKTGEASSVQTIQHTMDAYQNSRKESQPRLPSAGCSFKNPEGSAAGKLIDQSGLKGFSVGGAEVSDVHANFIVNRGTATASDVISLINELRKKVYQKTGYELEPEVILFGDKWENYLDSLPKESCTSLPVSQP
ncbi:MAG: UDP-N-acetylmuramate dehydrogenase [Verrucomicrobia bacterium]|nr:UDP-N-acetylmuramate dehydrogenase [Verrucomicrobiota bacterium]MDA1066604.1 UDP-N-acetylmuramate dehydrogenase [Verrucomicrobiota bacterium]